MDGGGRLLGSVSGGGGLVLAGGQGDAVRWPRFSLPRLRAGVTERPAARYRRKTWQTGTLSHAWVGMALAAAVVGGSFLYGACLGGEYQSFVVRNGSPLDLAAKAIGFEIASLKISGLDQLTEDEVLSAAGISDRKSLLFLDASDIRNRLKAVPLVRDVTVRKLFPNDLVLNITERGAAALWQKDGALVVVAADGVAIDDVRDARFNALPFVVGPGANEHLKDYLALLDAAGDLRDRIKAGIYVGERRWTLQMDSGVEVMLPEIDPKTALARFAALEHTAKITDKDVLSLDLRVPGRITARLSEDAAAARAAMLAKRPKKVMKE